jgi:hypothetical protein
MAPTNRAGGALGGIPGSRMVPKERGTAVFRELLAAARASAVHLEMRDNYHPSDPAFLAWKDGQPVEGGQSWRDLITATVARGVVVRRARVVSEPVTDYIRYEHSLTAGHNIAAGELVRWLPRRQASDLTLPGNDFWLFDSETVLFNHFTGVGESAGRELTDDPAVAKLCGSAFDAVWERAIPHEQYRI